MLLTHNTKSNKQIHNRLITRAVRDREAAQLFSTCGNARNCCSSLGFGLQRKIKGGRSSASRVYVHSTLNAMLSYRGGRYGRERPTLGPHLGAISVVYNKVTVGVNLGGEGMGSARHTEKFMGANQDSTSLSVAPEVPRTSRDADAPAFVALRAPLRQTQRLTGIRL